MVFKYAIALSGGIASGKSSVVEIMRSLGFDVIDADKIAHKILDEQRDKVSEIFGDTIVVDGRIDRKVLGAIVFEDKSKLKSLEDILHPLIYQEIESQALSKDSLKRAYFVDIPLFFESDRYRDITKSLVVYTPASTQLKRLMKRDNYTKDEALLRIESQMDIEQKRELATYIIDNSKDIARLRESCIDIQHKIERSI